jgi:hypothetical protein
MSHHEFKPSIKRQEFALSSFENHLIVPRIGLLPTSYFIADLLQDLESGFVFWVTPLFFPPSLSVVSIQWYNVQKYISWHFRISHGKSIKAGVPCRGRLWNVFQFTFKVRSIWKYDQRWVRLGCVTYFKLHFVLLEITHSWYPLQQRLIELEWIVVSLTMILFGLWRRIHSW